MARKTRMKVKLDDVELEIEKEGKIVMIYQKVAVLDAEDHETMEEWLIGEAEIVAVGP